MGTCVGEGGWVCGCVCVYVWVGVGVRVWVCACVWVLFSIYTRQAEFQSAYKGKS
jgi:hypothetical protein